MSDLELLILFGLGNYTLNLRLIYYKNTLKKVFNVIKF